MRQIKGQMSLSDFIDDNALKEIQEPYHFDYNNLRKYKGCSEYIKAHKKELPFYDVWLKNGKMGRKFDVCVWIGWFQSLTMGEQYDLKEIDSYKKSQTKYSTQDFHYINQYSFIPCHLKALCDHSVGDCRCFWCNGEFFKKKESNK